MATTPTTALAIPHPSPRANAVSASSSPIHQSSAVSWYHLISVAFQQSFSDRCAPADSKCINDRWKRLCVEKKLSAPVNWDNVDLIDLTQDEDKEDIKPKRKRGRPRRVVDPIDAAEKNLRKIEEISDLQWEQPQSSPVEKEHRLPEESSLEEKALEEKAPQPVLYFTTLPKPTKAPPQKRTLSSEKLTMICMRARVRAKRLKEPHKFLPKGPSLGRNLRLMKKRMDIINRKKGRIPEPHESDHETPRRARKRKRKST